MRAPRALYLTCAVLALAGPARGTPGVLAPEPQLEPNYRRAAALGLEWILLRVFADPDSLARFAALPDSPAHRLTRALEDGGRFWIWREGADLLVDVDGGPRHVAASAAPDSIDDMLIVDYGTDGTPDRIVDWEDLDGDRREDLILETEDRDGDGCFDAWRQTRAGGRGAPVTQAERFAADLERWRTEPGGPAWHP